MEKKIKKMLFVELGLLLLVLLIYIILKTDLINLIPECFIRKNFGILCPSCGGTRMVFSIMNFKFIEAFKYNPVLFLILLYLGVINFIYIINSFRKKEILTFIYPKKPIFWVIFVFFLLIFTIIRNI